MTWCPGGGDNRQRRGIGGIDECRTGDGGPWWWIIGRRSCEDETGAERSDAQDGHPTVKGWPMNDSRARHLFPTTADWQLPGVQAGSLGENGPSSQPPASFSFSCHDGCSNRRRAHASWADRYHLKDTMWSGLWSISLDRADCSQTKQMEPVGDRGKVIGVAVG